MAQRKKTRKTTRPQQRIKKRSPWESLRNFLITLLAGVVLSQALLGDYEIDFALTIRRVEKKGDE